MSEPGGTTIDARRQMVTAMSNDALIVDLLQTVNHLSRWLTPIHDQVRLDWTSRRSQVSVKDLLQRLRDHEVKGYSFMNAIVTQINPDLDRVPAQDRSPLQREADAGASALIVMAEFRRVRESSTSLLRALPDNAWSRGGYSRTSRDWTIRELAESLAINDWEQLGLIDEALNESGLRKSVARVSQVSRDHLREPFLAALDSR
jgi:hypothetical protein